MNSMHDATLVAAAGGAAADRSSVGIHKNCAPKSLNGSGRADVASLCVCGTIRLTKLFICLYGSFICADRLSRII